MYLGMENVLSDAGTPNVITIEPDRADSNFLFTPYLLTGIRDADPAPAWHEDAYLEGSGQASYTFESFRPYGDSFITGQNEYALAGVRENVLMSVDVSGVFDYEGYAFGFDIYSEGTYGIYTLDKEIEVPDDVMEGALQVVADRMTNASISYDAFEADYQNYIIHEYTQLPDGLKERLLEWWRGLHAENEIPLETQPFYAAERDVSYRNWDIAAKLVAKEVSAAATYTTEPGAQPQNRDFVEYFLTQSKKGYCTHFASATTAMLRALGIPSRYVEGYIVGQSTFGSDGWADVSAKKAHAWSEIWLPDVGWVPVESTPAGTAVTQIEGYSPAAPAQSGAAASPTPPPANTPAPAATPTPPPVDTQAQNGTAKKDPQQDTLLLLIVLGAGAAALLLITRQVIKTRRENSFFDADTSRAALALYEYLTRLSSYGAEISQEATAIAQKARFSQHTIDAKELNFLKNEAQKNRTAALRVMPPLKKIGFWFKGY